MKTLILSKMAITKNIKAKTIDSIHHVSQGNINTKAALVSNILDNEALNFAENYKVKKLGRKIKP